MGLFRAFSRNRKTNPQKKLLQEEIDLQKKLLAQDEQIKSIHEAEADYAANGDLDALLHFWENIWNGGGLLFNGSKWAFRLPDLYIQEKRYDEALGILALLEKTIYKEKAQSYSDRVLKLQKKR